jgi:adenosylcobinamide-phosphate synthase
MVPSGIGLVAAVLFAALVIDRLVGDPRTPLHPVALLGRFIGIWGKPAYYPVRAQRIAGILFWIFTVLLFSLPFYLFAALAPSLIYLCIAPFLLKCCLAWRALEEHTLAVTKALAEDIDRGREQVKLLVSRNTAELDSGLILSAAYESMTENLTDSIIAPLCYFCLFGLSGAAAYRAANTMDAMLGYRDERERLGWFSARMDDIANFVPARITVILLLGYFAMQGRLRAAFRILRRDGRNRPGFNGGPVMAVMAGGLGIRFEKPGAYTIGDEERALCDVGPQVFKAVRFCVLAFAVIAGGTLILLGWLINSTGI